MPASGRVIPLTIGVSAFPGVLLALGYLVVTFAGIFGFVTAPVTSAAVILGYSYASILWNLSLVFGGLIGVFSRVKRAPRTEVIAVEAIATVLVLWSVFVFISPTINDQSGFVLTGTALLMYGWAAGTRRYLLRRTELLDEGDREET